MSSLLLISNIMDTRCTLLDLHTNLLALHQMNSFILRHLQWTGLSSEGSLLCIGGHPLDIWLELSCSNPEGSRFLHYVQWQGHLFLVFLLLLGWHNSLGYNNLGLVPGKKKKHIKNPVLDCLAVHSALPKLNLSSSKRTIKERWMPALLSWEKGHLAQSRSLGIGFPPLFISFIFYCAFLKYLSLCKNYVSN